MIGQTFLMAIIYVGIMTFFLIKYKKSLAGICTKKKPGTQTKVGFRAETQEVEAQAEIEGEDNGAFTNTDQTYYTTLRGEN